MELRQLEYFVAVVEEESVTRASSRVLVAQSGVSAQVRRLEAELGVALLERGARRVSLTEAGAAVLPFARDALAAVAPGHALCDRASLSLDELDAYPLICLPRGTGVRAILDAAGVRARIAFEASDTGVLAQLALRGLGVAILPAPAAGALHTLELGLRGRVALCWRAGGPSSPAARAFVSHARGSV